MTISYCPQCAHPVDQIIPPGDNLHRSVCPQCQHVHYENPKVIVGCVAEWENKILLCRRAIAPRFGYWTLPAGFMENGESTAEGAYRETLEETCANVIIEQAFALINIPAINQVHVFHRGRLTSAHCAATSESLAARLYHASKIPWQDLAFESVRYCLLRYLDDKNKGQFGFHETVLQPF